MKLSTTVRYAARALAQLAAVNSYHPISVRDISDQQAVSAKYLERILKTLKAGGLVQAVRGKHGGYILGKPADCITLKDVFDILEGSAAPVECVDCPTSCERHELCPTRDTWVELKRAIETVLERTTIQDLVARQNCKLMAVALDYEI